MIKKIRIIIGTYYELVQFCEIGLISSQGLFCINLIYKIDSMYKIDYAPPRKNPDNSILLPIRSNTWAHTYS